MTMKNKEVMTMKKQAGLFSVIAVAVMAFLFVGIGASYYHGKNVIDEKVSMGMVSHTEYKSNEVGQIVARIVDYQGNPIVATCNATIKYPDKSNFVSTALMTASTVSGDYYYSFTTPSITGIYEYQALCRYGGGNNQRQFATNSFHLSPALNTIGQINTTVTNIQTAMGGNFTRILSAISAMNVTVLDKLSGLNASMVAHFTGLNASISSQIASMNSSILHEIRAINVTVDLTPVLNKLSSVNASLYTKLVSLDTKLNGMNATMVADFAAIQSRFTQVDRNLTIVVNKVSSINTTVTNIWDTLSLNVVVKLDSLLASNAQINRTVNLINGTTNQILTNQQNQVYMSVVSG
jgi:hypothetical protein